MERYKTTLADLNQAIERNHDDARKIAHQGETNCLMKQYDEALTDFSQAIRQNPTYVWAIAHRGETYSLMKRYGEALMDFNQAIELKPDYAWAIAHRGKTYRFMGKHYYEKALADFSRAIDLKPDYAWAIAYRARTYDLLRRYEEALVDFDRAIALDETLFSDWRSERGMLLSYCGRYAEAIACCQQALLENSDDRFALYNIAVFKTRWKGLADARTDIDKARIALLAAVNTETRGIVLYRLGGLAALEGKTAQALNYLQEAIPLEKEAIESARHDIAWLELRDHPRFQFLIADTTGEHK